MAGKESKSKLNHIKNNGGSLRAMRLVNARLHVVFPLDQKYLRQVRTESGNCAGEIPSDTGQGARRQVAKDGQDRAKSESGAAVAQDQ